MPLRLVAGSVDLGYGRGGLKLSVVGKWPVPAPRRRNMRAVCDHGVDINCKINILEQALLSKETVWA